MQKLLALPAATLLEKFGSGKHAPGSGSAAALLGLLSAELVLTVGRLTLLREKYKANHTTIQAVCIRIESDLIPRLSALFQEDAEIFDKVIAARRARDAAKDQAEKRKMSDLAISELKVATAIPFRIADASMELIDLASTVFDGGFEGARGDTGVAISSAVAGVLSAVFVINLNLKTFRGSYWARQQRKNCDKLQAAVEAKYHTAMSRVVKLRAEDITSLAVTDTEDFIASLSQSAKTSYSNREIEDRAAAVQTIVWRKRPGEWFDPALRKDHVDLLNPKLALEILGYSFDAPDTLGMFKSGSRTFEVAGLLENDLGKVSISRQMAPAVRRFTAAHELGHVVLHPHLREAHRDRPLDGSNPARAKVEQEADRFASYYLMPPNLLAERFRSTFANVPFVLADDTAFSLLGKGLNEARAKFQTLRNLSKQLARTERYNGRSVNSLAAQFGVSIEAMAIRLEELGLVMGDL